uniref:Nucleoprotein n=1 Tax=Raphidiopteran orthomyxo-related virus OKIAV180 TaxID=2792563 RepID=A0A7T0M3I6_9ORTO|nr:nucleoprotein [Raphidiopteran orthomyxo-related virus OKIAV180]
MSEHEDVEMSAGQDVAGPSGIRRGEKRNIRIVDADSEETEITTAKKPRIQLDNELKVKCLKFISRAFLDLVKEIKDSDEARRDLSFGIQVGNILSSVHNILRQGIKGQFSTLQSKAVSKGFTILSGGTYSITLETAKRIVIEAAKRYGLEYNARATSGNNNWLGTVGPYLNFCCAFGMRMKELRTGHSMMPLKKSDSQTTAANVAQYGLEGCHHILLEGISFPPEKRSSMTQSLGPMTALLCYIRSETKYAEKWKIAAKRALAHIPFIDDILGAIHGQKANDIRTLVKVIADILRIITPRQQQRATFPFNFLALYVNNLMEKDPTKIWTNLNGTQLSRGDEGIGGIDFSGIGAVKLYQATFKAFEWTLNGKFDSHQAGQIVFHSVFGTYKEDLGILSEITDYRSPWATRENMGSSFQKQNTEGRQIKYTKIGLRYWAKLAGASQTGLLAANYSQDSSLPVFSGSRRISFPTDFFEHMRRSSAPSTQGKSITQLTSSLLDVLYGLMDNITKEGSTVEMGTTKWFDVASLTNLGFTEATDFVAIGSNRFFLGRDN